MKLAVEKGLCNLDQNFLLTKQNYLAGVLGLGALLGALLTSNSLSSVRNTWSRIVSGDRLSQTEKMPLLLSFVCMWGQPIRESNGAQPVILLAQQEILVEQ